MQCTVEEVHCAFTDKQSLGSVAGQVWLEDVHQAVMASGKINHNSGLTSRAPVNMKTEGACWPANPTAIH